MRFFDAFLPASIAGDPWSRRRGRSLIGAAWGLALAVSVGVVARLAIADLYPLILVVSALCVALFVLAPFVLRSSKSLRFSGLLVVAGLFLLIFGTGSMVGGLNGPVLMSAPLVPMVAVYLLGSRIAVRVIVALILAIGVFVWLPRAGFIANQPPLDPSAETLARGLFLALTVLISGYLAVFVERQRVAIEGRMRRGEALYQRLFEQSKDIVALSTPAGRLIDINQAGVDFYGAESKDELLNRMVTESYVHAVERQEILVLLAQHGYVQDHETQHFNLRGEKRVLSGTTSTIRGDDGEIEMLLAILRDVTDRRRAETERQELLEELAAKNDELERFSEAVSHDLKAPLQTINGFSALMTRAAQDGRLDEMARYQTIVARSAKGMAAMINDLLELSQLGRQPLELSEVDSLDVAQQAVSMLSGQIQEAGARVVIAEDLPRLQTDATLLRLIFQNLVDNAVKFSRDSPDASVHVEASRDGDKIRFAVRDNGPGIAPEHHAEIFEAFRRLDKEIDGSGVGLASVRRAVVSLGGEISVDSGGRGQGCTFHFTIPAAEGSEPSPTRAS